jgi:hypothetical protein
MNTEILFADWYEGREGANVRDYFSQRRRAFAEWRRTRATSARLEKV